MCARTYVSCTYMSCRSDRSFLLLRSVLPIHPRSSLRSKMHFTFHVCMSFLYTYVRSATASYVIKRFRTRVAFSVTQFILFGISFSFSLFLILSNAYTHVWNIIDSNTIAGRTEIFSKFNIIKEILETLTIFFYSSPFFFRPNECSGKSTKKKKDKKQNCGCFGPIARARTCVYQHGRVRGVSVSPIGNIYLNAFFFTRRARGLSVKRLLLWLSVRCTAIQMSVRGTFDQADLRTWSVRGQFSFLPFVIVRVQRCRRFLGSSRSAVRIDTFDYWR